MTIKDGQEPTTVDDEFWNGLWWRPDGGGRLRNASVLECVEEIVRLRKEVIHLNAELSAAHSLHDQIARMIKDFQDD